MNKKQLTSSKNETKGAKSENTQQMSHLIHDQNEDIPDDLIPNIHIIECYNSSK